MSLLGRTPLVAMFFTLLAAGQSPDEEGQPSTPADPDGGLTRRLTLAATRRRTSLGN